MSQHEPGKQIDAMFDGEALPDKHSTLCEMCDIWVQEDPQGAGFLFVYWHETVTKLCSTDCLKKWVAAYPPSEEYPA